MYQNNLLLKNNTSAHGAYNKFVPSAEVNWKYVQCIQQCKPHDTECKGERKKVNIYKRNMYKKEVNGKEKERKNE